MSNNPIVIPINTQHVITMEELGLDPANPPVPEMAVQGRPILIPISTEDNA